MVVDKVNLAANVIHPVVHVLGQEISESRRRKVTPNKN